MGVISDSISIARDINIFLNTHPPGIIPVELLQKMLPEQQERALIESVKTLTGLSKQLQHYNSESPVIDDLSHQAADALKVGEIKQTEELINQASDQESEASEMYQQMSTKRKLRSAKWKAWNGDLMRSQLAYRKAADYYQAAVSLVPEGHEKILADYLRAEGMALMNAGDFAAAEAPLKRALEIDEKILGSMHTELIKDLNPLSMLYEARSQYDEAIAHATRAEKIHEAARTMKTSDFAETLRNLALLYEAHEKYQKGFHYAEKALRVQKQLPEPDHYEIAATLNVMGKLQYALGKYGSAEVSYKQASEIWEKYSNQPRRDAALTWNNLGVLYYSCGKHQLAEASLNKALVLWRRTYSSDDEQHPDMAETLNNLGLVYLAQNQQEKAEAHCKEALDIWERPRGGPVHRNVATIYNNLALIYLAQKKYEPAKHFFKAALQIWENSGDPKKSDAATVLCNLALIYHAEKDYKRALMEGKRALKMQENALENKYHPALLPTLLNLAIFYASMDRQPDVKKCLERAETICQLQESGMDAAAG